MATARDEKYCYKVCAGEEPAVTEAPHTLEGLDIDDEACSSDVNTDMYVPDQHRQLESVSKRERGVRSAGIALILAFLVGLTWYSCMERGASILGRPGSGGGASVMDAVPVLHEEVAGEDGDDFSKAEIEQMKQRLTPKELIFEEDGKTVAHRQFLHLHHMKTGGTSMDYLIRCATSRLVNMGYDVPYGSIHECNPGMYSRCKSGEDHPCVDRMANASVISFCAPLRDLPVFSWVDNSDAIMTPTAAKHPIHSVTVLRHPVERVWSMYRFRTKYCYKCNPLKDVYEGIQNGTFSETCADQLQNHMTRNLIQHDMTGQVDEVVKQAIEDIKSFFTIVGLTEDLDSTRIMVEKVFPWMAETINGSDKVCSLPHANASPLNNGCGPGGAHMELSSHPSEEDAELIRQHNQLDLLVYHAAERHHRLQKIALGLEQEEEP